MKTDVLTGLAFAIGLGGATSPICAQARGEITTLREKLAAAELRVQHTEEQRDLWHRKACEDAGQLAALRARAEAAEKRAEELDELATEHEATAMREMRRAEVAEAALRKIAETPWKGDAGYLKAIAEAALARPGGEEKEAEPYPTCKRCDLEWAITSELCPTCEATPIEKPAVNLRRGGNWTPPKDGARCYLGSDGERCANCTKHIWEHFGRTEYRCDPRCICPGLDMNCGGSECGAAVLPEPTTPGEKEGRDA